MRLGNNPLLAEMVGRKHLGRKMCKWMIFDGAFLCRFYLGWFIKQQRFLHLRLRLYDNQDINSLIFKSILHREPDNIV